MSIHSLTYLKVKKSSCCHSFTTSTRVRQQSNNRSSEYEGMLKETHEFVAQESGPRGTDSLTTSEHRCVAVMNIRKTQNCFLSLCNSS